MELTTTRLKLRAWRDDDIAPFAAMNADSRVREFFPSTLTFEESLASAEHIAAHWNTHGFGLWAVEVPGTAPFIGFVGLSIPAFDAPFMPCVEVGWRLAVPYWNRGYATEGGRAAIAFGFDVLGLPEIVSMTTESNLRSRRVMERLGMHRDPSDDFDHPNIAAGHRLRRHVLYRLRRDYLPYHSETPP